VIQEYLSKKELHLSFVKREGVFPWHVWEAGLFPLELGEFLIIWLCFPLAAEFFHLLRLSIIAESDLGRVIAAVCNSGQRVICWPYSPFPMHCGCSFLCCVRGKGRRGGWFNFGWETYTIRRVVKG
jgi:hypothetical protein